MNDIGTNGPTGHGGIGNEDKGYFHNAISDTTKPAKVTTKPKSKNAFLRR
jgi:hypothetical protein